MYVRANFADIYLQGMSDRSMQSGMELAREIQLTVWSTAGEQGKLVFCGFDFSQREKNRLSIVQITDQFKFFTLKCI